MGEERKKRVSFNPEPRISIVPKDGKYNIDPNDNYKGRSTMKENRFIRNKELNFELNQVFKSNKVHNEKKIIEEKLDLDPEGSLELTKDFTDVNKDIEHDINMLLKKSQIRFLDSPMDNTLTSSSRRESISKTKNEVKDELIQWYRYSQRVLIAHFAKMSSFLIEQMEKLQLSINGETSYLNSQLLNLDGGGINLDVVNFKKIRNESRIYSKTEWYGYRKMEEEHLNVKLLENAEIIKKKIHEKSQRLDFIKKDITELIEKNKDLADKNLQEAKNSQENNNSQENDNINDNGLDLLSILKNEKDVQISKKVELESIEQIVRKSKEKTEITLQKIEYLNTEISKLEDLMASKKADTKSIEFMKSEMKDYEDFFFNLKIINVTKEKIIFKTLYFDGTEIICYFDDASFKIKKFELKCDELNTNFCIFKSFFVENFLSKNISNIKETFKNEKDNKNNRNDFSDENDFVDNDEFNIKKRSLDNSQYKINNLSYNNSKKYFNTENLGDIIISGSQTINQTPINNRRISVTVPSSKNEAFIRDMNLVDTILDKNWSNQIDSYGGIKVENNKTIKFPEYPRDKDDQGFDNITNFRYKSDIHLNKLLTQILFKIVLINNIKKEIERLKPFMKIDTLYSNKKICLRIYMQIFHKDTELLIIYAFIDENLNLFHDKEFICNLVDKVDGFGKFIMSFTEKNNV